MPMVFLLLFVFLFFLVLLFSFILLRVARREREERVFLLVKCPIVTECRSHTAEHGPAHSHQVARFFHPAPPIKDRQMRQTTRASTMLTLPPSRSSTAKASSMLWTWEEACAPEGCGGADPGARGWLSVIQAGSTLPLPRPLHDGDDGNGRHDDFVRWPDRILKSRTASSATFSICIHEI